MQLADCRPGQRLVWLTTRARTQPHRAVRVCKVTAARVVVWVPVKGRAVRRTVKPERLYRRGSAELKR